MHNLIDNSKLPDHIAFIIDGNGRWAKERNLPRTYGHKKGVEAVKDTIYNCLEYGIKIVSFYVFSTENWQRPKEEVDEIFNLLNDFSKKYKSDFVKNGVKMVHSGDLTKLNEESRLNIEKIEEETKNNSKLICNICINYGSRQEIVKAVNELILLGKNNVTEQDIKEHLYTANLADPDFIVRTSGEQRLSNFMLFQSAYSEFYFPKIYWPDFDKIAFEHCLIEFQKRTRRYGRI